MTTPTLPCAIAAACLLLTALAAPSLLHAQERDLPNVEFFPGPVVSSNKIISMGGAYTAIAQGADAHLINPASFSNRARHTTAPSWFSGDWTISWFNDAPSAYADDEQDLRDSFHIDLGFDLKFGRLGLGLHAYEQSFSISTPSRTVAVTAGYGGLGLGWSFLEEQLDVGLLLGTASLTISEMGDIAPQLYTSEGQGVTFGAHLALDGKPWQLGIRARREIRGYDLSNAQQEDDGREPVGRRAQITIPKQLTLGAAYDLPARSYSGRPTPVLLTTDLVLTGKSVHATALDDFALAASNDELVTQTRPMTLAPHVGAAYELVHDRLRLRAGSYWEPDRSPTARGRAHVTLGGEVRLHLIWDWRIDACLDLAAGYSNWGLGLGFWTPSPSSLSPSSQDDS